jgi:orotate phosphoribosyltransferase
MASVREILGRFVYQAESPKSLGWDGRFRVSYFVDLLSAVHIPENLSQLADDLADFVRGHSGLDGCTALVCPKAGNTLLVRETALRLGLQSGFVRESILFGRWIEGSPKSGEKVILVDDVSADGEMLSEAVLNLRKGGIYVNQAFVIVDRIEGDALRMLGELGVDLRHRYQLNDNDLRGFKENASH